MIKTYTEIYLAGHKKDGSPFRRMRIHAIDETTGQLFELFNVGMTPLNLLMYDTLIQHGKIQAIEPHDINIGHTDKK